MAHAHYTDINTIFSKYWSNDRYSKRDIDLYEYPNDFWMLLSQLTGINESRLRAMQLRRFEGIVQETILNTGRQHWVVPTGRQQKNGKFKNIRFCPECLKVETFYKQEWRLLFVNVCTAHKCYLSCSCPECGKSIELTKLCPLQLVSMCLCGFDLRDAKTDRAKKEEIDAVKKLKKIMKEEYFILNAQWHYSLGLFFVLRIVVSRLIAVERKRQKKEGYGDFKIKWIEEMHPVQLSPFLAQAVEILLDDWPNSFVTFFKKNKLTNRHAILDKYRYDLNNIPKWFLDGMDLVIEVQFVKTDEELRAMFDYCEKHEITTLREIGEFCGYSLNHTFLLRKRLSTIYISKK